MYLFLLIIFLLVSIILISIIMLQQGKNASIGSNYSIINSSTLFRSSTSGNIITKITVIFAVLFFTISLILSNLNSNTNNNSKIKSKWENIGDISKSKVKKKINHDI